jgi:hypothetical protein
MGEAPNEDLTAEQVRALREDIAQTREDIGDTLEAIGEKLSPRNMVQEAADSVRDAAARKVENVSRTVGNVMTTASERASDLADQARETVDVVRRRVGDNALPAALTAIGIGWIAYNAMRGDGSEGVQPYNARWRDVPEPGSGEGYWASARDEDESTESWRRESRRGESLRGRVNSTAHRLACDVARIFRQNPLAFAVAGAAVGVAIGLSVPETETENRMLGETRDAVLDRAREVVANPTQR